MLWMSGILGVSAAMSGYLLVAYPCPRYSVQMTALSGSMFAN
jgi:hypothetical protein